MKQKQEEEEMENIRKMSHFKATPIRKYKPVQSAEPKELTIPQEFKFNT